MRKIAIKPLTWADLSFFEYRFGSGDDKSIILERAALETLFPALRASKEARTLPVDLWVFGPAAKAPVNIQRKLSFRRTSGSCYLGGEFLLNPIDDPTRFNDLAPGDYAVFAFEGDVVPSSAMMLLVAAAAPEDRALHAALGRFGLAGRETMRVLSETGIVRLVAELGLPDDHPLAGFAISEELQEAAIGSVAAVERLRRRAHAPNVSPEALRRAREQAEAIGRLGEELVAAHLQREQDSGRILSFDWVAEANAVAPMDFRIGLSETGTERIDVKTTAGPFERPFHISLSELREMAAPAGGPYRIYRVYEAGQTGARLRISDDLCEFGRAVIVALAALPPGIMADAVSVDPAGISFGEPTVLIPGDDGEDA
ncbi:MAG TPA: DUF3883 domain-containing protein [Stellaceae bacterium]|nr:DUF3883 domain-containing protein [Stellaceae bacterium]